MGNDTPIRAIIIDDEELMRTIIKSALMALEVDVVGEAGNGKDGIKLFDESEPDLVLLDIRMPEMDGLEALTTLKGKNHNVYVVMLTAIDDADVIDECMIAGAKDYLKKGIPVSEIITRLQRHINRLYNAI